MITAARRQDAARDGSVDDEIDEEFEDAEGPELDDEEEFEVGDDPELDDDVEADPALEADEDLAEGDDDEEEEPAVPVRRAGSGDEEGDDDEDELDPDDVEADLDTILKDRIASGDDLEDEEEDEVEERAEAEVVEGVTAKREGEFTCTNCFMIVHPRQFGRKDRLTCPVGDEDCPAIVIVRQQLG